MKISTDEKGRLIIQDVYEPCIFESEEGKQLAICMRDDIIEMKFPGADYLWRIDMEDCSVEKFRIK